MEEGADRDALFKFAVQSEAAKRLEAGIKLAASETAVGVRVEDLDADPYLLNVENGTLNLRTGELRPHRREDLLTKVAAVAYDRDAPCPRWLAFLDETFGGDAALIGSAGYALTGDTSEQCLLVLEGSGANGKTTAVEALAHVLGDYAAHVDSSTFMVGAGGGGPRPDVARLHGARLVVSSEVEQGVRFAEVFVKQATGGDALVVRQLYREPFEFRPEFKVFITANSLPTIRGTDHAIWRRMRRVPFHHKVERPDKQLPAKLRAEAPGIQAWMVEGCLAWQREGLEPPAAVRVATEEYRTGQDTVGAFLRERCRKASGATIPANILRAAYVAHCRDGGVHPVPEPAFKAAVEGGGFEWDRGKHGRFYRGVEVDP